MFKIKLIWDEGQPTENTCFLGDAIGMPVTYASREAAEWIVESNEALERLRLEVVEIPED
tara:strand:- start:1586 stop:1765 length:180 start_codon:yes stop_codon:yes gene_type:complete